ncbi:sialidase family protein, partial [Lysobacter sp. N42]|uniref:sialidase family protein n=1 Tax=Lysobacter sp. N42 TaxID=2545719 RepID=UPI00104B37BF
SPEAAPPAPQGAAAAGKAPLAPRVRPWRLPDDAWGHPDLVVAPDGSLLLSWLGPVTGGNALRFARFDGERWSASRTIAAGEDWFVNWADIPHIAATPDGALWAHWLQKSGEGKYAYGVVLSRSADGGATWSAPVRVHDDGTPTEHGFVSMWPVGRDALGIAWLDGRETAGGHGGHGGSGAMTLRSATFDARLQRRGEVRIDASTCDCCQTDVAIADGSPVLVYRDRAPGEIRDIAATRLLDGQWTAPRLVHADGWQMPACPVNGPSVAAQGREVTVGWYTMAGGVARMRLARSTDGGAHFGPALEIDQGPAVLGRASVAHHDGRAWIAWLREEAGRQSLWLAAVSPDATRIEHRIRIAEFTGRGRGTGLPHLVAAKTGLWLVWTDIEDGAPRLHGAHVTL